MNKTLRRSASAHALLVAALMSCSPTLDTSVQPDPSPGHPGDVGRQPVPGVSPTADIDERNVRATMQKWLGNFADAEELYQSMNGGRYSEDMTVDGAIRPLPEPYVTRYWVHEVGREYSVSVSYPATNQGCSLSDGRQADGSRVGDGGKITCESH